MIIRKAADGEAVTDEWKHPGKTEGAPVGRWRMQNAFRNKA
jgi:hypothetical protein